MNETDLLLQPLKEELALLRQQIADVNKQLATRPAQNNQSVNQQRLVSVSKHYSNLNDEEYQLAAPSPLIDQEIYNTNSIHLFSACVTTTAAGIPYKSVNRNFSSSEKVFWAGLSLLLTLLQLMVLVWIVIDCTDVIDYNEQDTCKEVCLIQECDTLIQLI